MKGNSIINELLFKGSSFFVLFYECVSHCVRNLTSINTVYFKILTPRITIPLTEILWKRGEEVEELREKAAYMRAFGRINFTEMNSKKLLLGEFNRFL